MRKEREKLFEALIENSSDVLMIMKPDGILDYASSSIEQVLGYGQEELVGRNTFDYIHPDDLLESFEEVVRGSQQPPGYRATSTQRARHKDGSWRWIESTGRLVRDGSEISAIVASCRDITERKRAEHKLRGSEERLRAIFQSTRDGVIVIDLAGTVVEANEAALSITGYSSKSEAIGKNCLEFVAPRDRDRLVETMLLEAQKARKGETVELAILTPDGRETDIESSGAVLYDSSGDPFGFIVTTRNITERKQMEKQLRESEATNRALLDAIPDAIFRLDSGGRYVGFIPAKGFPTLVPPHEFLGGTLEEVLPPELAKNSRYHLEQALETGETQSYEYSLSFDERERHFEARLVKTREEEVLGIVRDITERKQMEEELQETQRRYQSILDNPLIMVYINDGTGLFLDANDCAIQRLGYTRDDLRKVAFETITHPDDYPKAMEAQLEIMTKGRLEQPVQARIFTKSGEQIWIETCGFPIKSEQEEGYRGLGIAQDITERKRAEEELRETHATLEKRVEERTAELAKINKELRAEVTRRKRVEKRLKQSLQDKEVLLKEVHHRVKNNLQVISSMVNLQSKYTKDQQVADMFKETQNRLMSMAILHEKLYRSKNLNRINFARYVDSVITDLFRSYGTSSKSIQVKTDIDRIPVGIDIAIPCGLLINELVSNCLKHAFPDDRAGEISISLNAHHNNQLTLKVSDNGTGFPEDLDFRSTESLGLQLVNALTRQLAGTIEMNRNGGTAFSITFENVKHGETRRLAVNGKNPRRGR